jgi:hypothetical protein|tara:strand:+ start:363 stop:563 length:201 start_codon:yes stop_codon:yes gene_type:complete
MYVLEEVMTMLASTQGAGVTLPNLAFTLIMNSMQQSMSVPKTPTESLGTQSPATTLADTHHLDVKA